MQQDFIQEAKFIRAKKRVKAIKGFYVHFMVYILANIFISGIIIFGLMKSGYNFEDTFSNFGVYSTWVFWGIGMFFHWLGVFGSSVFFGENWEKKQLEKYMNDTKF
tara:strand:- start:813 stop:1130 length:318 start_codon:yes stop_codon:yes gene_type:complete